MSADDRTPEDAAGPLRDARTSGAPDIAASPTLPRFPVSRGAPERKLRRVDFYDRRAEVTDYEALTPTDTVRISFRVIDDELLRSQVCWPRWRGVRRQRAWMGRCAWPRPTDDRQHHGISRPRGVAARGLPWLPVSSLAAE